MGEPLTNQRKPQRKSGFMIGTITTTIGLQDQVLSPTIAFISSQEIRVFQLFLLNLNAHRESIVDADLDDIGHLQAVEQLLACVWHL